MKDAVLQTAVMVRLLILRLRHVVLLLRSVEAFFFTFSVFSHPIYDILHLLADVK